MDHDERERLQIERLVQDMRDFRVNVKQAKNIKEPPENYKNDSNPPPPKGTILIANYKNFKDEKKKEKRDGSERDVFNLEELFSQIGYQVKNIEDRTKTDTEKELLLFRGQLRNVDSIVIIMMSHGSDTDAFYTYDGEYMTDREIYELFSDKNCEFLRGKPKLFIFVHCREPESKNPSLLSNLLSKKDKTLSDIFVLHSALPRKDSMRHPECGSLFVYQMCKVFMEKSCESDIKDLIDHLNECLDQPLFDNQGCDIKYIRRYRKKFYFNPTSLRGEVDNGNNSNNGQDSDSDGNGSSDHDSDDNGNNDSGNDHSNARDGNGTNENNEDPTDNNGNTDKIETQTENPHTKKHALLINNLEGCDDDMNILKDLFESMSYTCELFSKVKYEQLKEVFENFQKKGHGDSAFIVYYGHGIGDNIITDDHYAIHFTELQREFNDVNCPNLSKKPKIFILNLVYFENKEKLKFGTTFSPSEDIQKIQADRDMFFLNVEIEGSHCGNGSLLTKALNRVFRENESKKELIEIMNDVSEIVDDLQNEENIQDYICELRSIKFTVDFKICRIVEDQEILTPAHVQGSRSEHKIEAQASVKQDLPGTSSASGTKRAREDPADTMCEVLQNIKIKDEPLDEIEGSRLEPQIKAQVSIEQDLTGTSCVSGTKRARKDPVDTMYEVLQNIKIKDEPIDEIEGSHSEPQIEVQACTEQNLLRTSSTRGTKRAKEEPADTGSHSEPQFEVQASTEQNLLWTSSSRGTKRAKKDPADTVIMSQMDWTYSLGNNSPKGIAAIIYVEDGAYGRADSLLLKHLWKELDYTVKEYRNPDKQELDWIMSNLEREVYANPNKHSSFSLSFIGHGGMVDGHEFLCLKNRTICYVNELYSRLSPSNFQGLAGKAKILFLQLCRGDSKHIPSEIYPSAATQTTELLPDLFILHTSSTGVSYYDLYTGESHFIKTVCEVFKSNFRSMDIHEMATIVSSKISGRKFKGYAQTVLTTSTLKKKFYFTGVRSKLP